MDHLPLEKVSQSPGPEAVLNLENSRATGAAAVSGAAPGAIKAYKRIVASHAETTATATVVPLASSIQGGVLRRAR